MGGAFPAQGFVAFDQLLVDVHFLAIQIGHAEVDAHVLVDVVGGASAIPYAVGIRDAQAAVFRLDRGVVVGKADTGFPGRVDVPGAAQRVTGRILELLRLVEADAGTVGAAALTAGGLELLEGAPVGPVDGVVHGKLLVQTVVTGELGLGWQIQWQFATDGLEAGRGALVVTLELQVYLGAIGQREAVVLVHFVHGAHVPAVTPVIPPSGG